MTFTTTFNIDSQESIKSSIKELESYSTYLKSLLDQTVCTSNSKKDTTDKPEGIQTKSFMLKKEAERHATHTKKNGHRGAGKLVREDVKFYTSPEFALKAANGDKSIVREIRVLGKTSDFKPLYFLGKASDVDNNNNARRCYSQLMARNYSYWEGTFEQYTSSQKVYTTSKK